MRKISKIIIHCSDSDIDEKHDNIEAIRRWHLANGWRDIGYHYFVRKNGTIEIGRQLKTIGAHSFSNNTSSIGICCAGKNNFTREQFESTSKIVRNLLDIFDLGKEDVFPHHFFDKSKTCPNFDISKITSLI